MVQKVSGKSAFRVGALAAAMVTVIGVGGCADGSQAGTVGEGALAGGLLGGVVGHFVPGGSALTGALIGTGAGAAVGAVVANNNAQQAQAESTVNAAIANAQQEQQISAKDASTSQQLADSTNAEIASLQDSLRSANITADVYTARLAALKSRVDTLQTMSTQAQARLDAAQKRQQTWNGQDGGQLAAVAASEAQSKAIVDNSLALVNKSLAAAPTS